MKNKKLNYILIPAVLFIWGAIIYNVVSGASGDEELPAYGTIPKVEREGMASLDSFVLDLDYKDPFLSRRNHTGVSSSYTGSVSNSSTSTSKPKKVEKPKVVEPPMDWSFIEYHGIFTNSDKKVGVATVTINSKDYLLDKGDEIEEVKLLLLTEDSIKISYQGKNAFIKKK